MDKLKDYFPAVLPFVFPGLPGVSCAFSTGVFGNISLDSTLAGDADRARRRKLAGLLGFSSWTEMRQLHGDMFAVNPEATPYEQPSCLEADGCCTDKPGRALLVKAADCQQVLLAHNSGRYVAALHVGWRGNLLGFPETGLAGFCTAYNLNAADVLAVRGPSLGPGRAEFVNFAREWPVKYTPWFNPASRCMDLWSLTKHQLLRAGLKPENIFGIDLCTNALREVFFSHRAKSAGRQAAVIFIREVAKEVAKL